MMISKQIEKVKIGKSKVIIIFTNQDKLEITPNTYTEFNLFPKKTLTKKEIDEIISRSEIDKYFIYVSNLLSSRNYSKLKIKEKLLKKGASESQVELVIELLMKYQLIDDKEIIKEYLEYADYKHFGYNRIKDDLFKKGITSFYIDKIKYDEVRELKQAKLLLPSLVKKYDKYNYSSMKKHCYEAYLRFGYNGDIALKALEGLPPLDEKKEIRLLKLDYEKAIRKYKDKLSEYEYKEKVTEYLLSKGYRYKDIKSLKE